jgi:hypothetical protein
MLNGGLALIRCCEAFGSLHDMKYPVMAAKGRPWGHAVIPLAPSPSALSLKIGIAVLRNIRAFFIAYSLSRYFLIGAVEGRRAQLTCLHGLVNPGLNSRPCVYLTILLLFSCIRAFIRCHHPVLANTR